MNVFLSVCVVTRMEVLWFAYGVLSVHILLLTWYDTISCKFFVVKYSTLQITINICLEAKQEDPDIVGGELFFANSSPSWQYTGSEDMSEVEFAKLLNHRPGWAVVHRGSHIHGVLPYRVLSPDASTTDRVRRSLICWLRSSSLRSLECPRCHSRSPQQHQLLVPMKVWRDGQIVDVTELTEDDQRSGLFVRAGFADGFLLPSSKRGCTFSWCIDQLLASSMILQNDDIYIRVTDFLGNVGISPNWCLIL